MCVSSAVSDYYMRPNWPHPPALWPPNQSFPQVVQSDPELKELLRKALQLLDKIDQRLGDRECMDETKSAFYRALDLDAPKSGER